MSVVTEPARRLHPLTILFYIGKRSRELLIPAAISAMASRRGSIESKLLFFSVALLVIATLSAVWKYFAFRYRFDADNLVVRTGIIFRNERHIPYNRIQNFDAVQNVLHRLLHVAIVHVQTGSGQEPEATFNVLPLQTLAEMRDRVFAKRNAAQVGRVDALVNDEGTAALPIGSTSEPVRPIATHYTREQPVPLLHLSSRDLLIAGIIENRGVVLVAAALGLLSRFDAVEKTVFERTRTLLPQWLSRGPEGNIGSFLLGAALLTVLTLLLISALSAAWAVVRLHGFSLTRVGNDLRAEYGLFTRVTATIPIHRVQTISLHQRFLHRRLNRAAIRITTAGGPGSSGEQSKSSEREWLAPLIALEGVPELLQQLDASLTLQHIAWTGAHPNAVTRVLRVSALWAAAITAGSALFIGWWAVLVGALLGARALVRSRAWVNNLGCAFVGERVVFRSGWLHQVTTVVPFTRVQSAAWQQSPFDRRAGMAAVSVDTAGLGSGALTMPYLHSDSAAELHVALARAAVRTPFRW